MTPATQDLKGDSTVLGRLRYTNLAVWFATALVSVALAAAPARSQELVGTVRDSVTRAPVRGAVVMLLDAGRTPLAQVLTTASGTFRLRRLPATTLRVIRIGYSPVEFPMDRLPTGTIDIAMIALGNRLPVVSVRTSPVCPERRDSREALALWSAATDGLYALVAATDSNAPPGTVTQLLYDKLLDDDGRRVVRQTVQIVRTGNVAPIRADRSPEDFVRDGYVERNTNSTTYYAPDPATLLDTTFAATHCLSLRNDRAHPGQVGVVFSPARGRETIPDIAGVLWMDRSPLALRSLEFEYRGVDRLEMDVRTGGQLDFETLSNGVPIIRAWHVRSPRLAWMDAIRRVRGQEPVRERVPLIVSRHETGGLIAVGRLADGTAWATPLAHVAGRVMNSRTGEPVPYATVTLDSTDYRTTTDGSGQFSFEGVLPGPYVARVADSLTIFRRRIDEEGRIVLDTAVLQVVARTATTRVSASVGHTESLELSLPWRAPVGSCYGYNDSEPRFVVTGHVLTPDSIPLGNAKVSFEWADTTRASIAGVNIVTRTESDGLFQVCGVPGDRTLQAIVSQGGIDYVGTSSVPLIDYDENGQRRQGNLRKITILVSPVGRRD
jgi:hypothetical protein